MNSLDTSNLRRFIVPEFTYGQGAINLITRHVKSFGAKKVLLVTDPGIIKAGWINKVEKNLVSEGIQYVIYKDITSNPKDYEVMTGVKVYKENGCDIIVSVGGGSPMDCAKGIGIVSTNNKHILEFEGIDEVPTPGPPLICIPTTAGTSADISQFAIINDSTRKVKITIISKTVIPDVSLIDPETTTTMPTELTASTGLDAFVHAFEAYVSNISSPIINLTSLEAIRLINENLIHALNYPNDMKYRNNMMMASLLSGMAFSNASLGLVHGMAHSLGGLLDLPHGMCNAVLLEYIIDYNFESCVEKYTNIGEALNLNLKNINPGERKSILIKKIKEFKKEAGINITLKELGVNKKDLDKLANNAIKDPCLATNPRNPKLEDIKDIYERAL